MTTTLTLDKAARVRRALERAERADWALKAAKEEDRAAYREVQDALKEMSDEEVAAFRAELLEEQE